MGFDRGALGEDEVGPVVLTQVHVVWPLEADLEELAEPGGAAEREDRALRDRDDEAATRDRLRGVLGDGVVVIEGERVGDDADVLGGLGVGDRSDGRVRGLAALLAFCF